MAIINTDIYNILSTANKLKHRFLPDELDETLAIDTYGYIEAITSKNLQSAIRIMSELMNEAFVSRAKLDKNLITHALQNNITDINATPAHMNIILGILSKDLESNMIDGQFIIDKNFPIYIEKFEFHLDYDIIITKADISEGKSVYSAHYNIERNNPTSNITNPYLKPPTTIGIGSNNFVIFNCQIEQITKTEISKKIITNNIIDNKTMVFSFKEYGQLSYFEVKVIDNEREIYLEPYFEGTIIKPNVSLYCYCQYIDAQSIRIKFDSSSYMPSIGSEVIISVYTTKGKSGNFKYDQRFLIDIESDIYDYKSISAYIMPQSDSINGSDSKSIKDLKRILPKEAFTKGCLTTETDLLNYFAILNNESAKLRPMKKTDNQMNRCWYVYLIMKDIANNVIPMNSIEIHASLDDFITDENNRYVLQAGTCFALNPSNWIATVIPEEEYNKYEFTYMTPYNIVINKNPLYASYYMMMMNDTKYLHFTYVNNNAPLQFITDSIFWKRPLRSNGKMKKYTLQFASTQSIIADMGMITTKYDQEKDEVVVDSNRMKAFVVFYRDGKIYRYKEAEMINADINNFTYLWQIELETTDELDNQNNIKIQNVSLTGMESYEYGYMNCITDTVIYLLAKFNGKVYGRYNIDTIVPGLEEYSVTNMYTVIDGLPFFINYTGLMSSKVIPIGNSDTGLSGFKIKGVPCIGYEYGQDNDSLIYLIDQLNYKKLYMDAVLMLLENTIEIDFKFYNTYGPSRTIYTEDKQRLNRVNTTWKFKLKLLKSSDVYTTSYIIRDIKYYIENINEDAVIHISNLITYITNTYKDSITYFDFVGINDYGPGMQHLYVDEILPVEVVPEFITVNTTTDELGNHIPDIQITLIE